MFIDVIQPGERSGQRALLSVDRFKQLAAGSDMNAVLLNVVAAQQRWKGRTGVGSQQS